MVQWASWSTEIALVRGQIRECSQDGGEAVGQRILRVIPSPVSQPLIRITRNVPAGSVLCACAARSMRERPDDRTRGRLGLASGGPAQAGLVLSG
jgi:hypothetical protein